jgi:hypothetical protein
MVEVILLDEKIDRTGTDWRVLCRGKIRFYR